MKILQKYILRKLTSVFLLVFIPFYMLQFLIRLILDFEDAGKLGVDGVLIKILHVTLSLSSSLLSFFFYLACVICLLGLNSRFELPAIRSLGAGKIFIGLPIVLAGLVLAVFQQTLDTGLLPLLKPQNSIRLEKQWVYTDEILLLKNSNDFNKEKPDYFSIFLDAGKVGTISQSTEGVQKHWKINEQSLQGDNQEKLLAVQAEARAFTSPERDYSTTSIISLTEKMFIGNAQENMQSILFALSRQLGSFLAFLLFGVIAVSMSDLPPRKFNYIFSIASCFGIWILYFVASAAGRVIYEAETIGPIWGGLFGSFILGSAGLALAFRRRYIVYMKSRREARQPRVASMA